MSVAIGAAEISTRLGLPRPTDEQIEVIEAPLDPIAVVAGAGSGKTETMAARVVWLVANGLVEPEAVLGLTFTRKAATELARRIRQRLAGWRAVTSRGNGATPLVAGESSVLTYAAYAGRLVSEHAMRLGHEPDARVISTAVAWQLAEQASRHHTGELPDDIGAPSTLPDYLLAMAGQLADHLVDPAEVERWCDEQLAAIDALPLGGRANTKLYPGKLKDYVKHLRHRRELLPLVAAYQAGKARVPAVDFGDQMTLAARLAALAPVQQLERERYRVVLLDEYQDTGHAQIETLRALFGDGHPVTAVGDPYQSIYGWRGASAGNMARFARTFHRRDGAPAVVSPLATSFRNDVGVLDAANVVAGPLRDEQPAEALRPRPGAQPGRVVLTRTQTVQDEAAWLAAQLRAEWDARSSGSRTAAVLVRRRSSMPAIADALLAVGLPVEIVGLGGLLTTPEVSDVVSTLRVLVQPEHGAALARLLTGARWRIGPRDLVALSRRARTLGRAVTPAAAVQQPGLFDETGPPAAEPLELRAVLATNEPVGIVEALDDLGPAAAYSDEGYRRLTALATELRYLRSRLSAPLSDLVAEVERVIGVDLEVDARADRAAVGRAHLDRFLDEAADFAFEADDATLPAFLAFLSAAEDEEHGLEAAAIEVADERVQLLTVHGAKGLEWDVVAVPSLVDEVFPARPDKVDWAFMRQQLPAALRGDRADLPRFTLAEAVTQTEVRDRLAVHHTQVQQRHGIEERRLAYVAYTRARSTLLLSGYVWDDTSRPRRPSPFLTEVLETAGPRPGVASGEAGRDGAGSGVVIDGWAADPPDDAANPVREHPRESRWPLDPYGPYPGDRGAGRRAAVTAGAELVREAMADAADVPSAADGTTGDGGDPAATGAATTVGATDDVTDATIVGWAADADRLLAERAALHSPVIDVPLPPQLSVSQLVELQRSPEEFAASLHRPVPRRPAPWARRGTRFHTWLEQRWGSDALLDLDELPGAADDADGDDEFDELRAAFERSVWATRAPHEVEVPFEMVVAGHVVRGRMDAVFVDPDRPEGWLVVDWKTGRRPSGGAAAAAAVQLAAYRLAWARLQGIADDDIAGVRAAFHYVGSDETVEPTTLLDADELRALVAGP